MLREGRTEKSYTTLRLSLPPVVKNPATVGGKTIHITQEKAGKIVENDDVKNLLHYLCNMEKKRQRGKISILHKNKR